MLYDNALLAGVYAHWWRRTGSALARRVAADTCAGMIAELRTAQGGFASALDADSDGEEGKFYAWTPGQLREALGAADGQYAAETFGVTREGTFEHGKSVLQLRGDPADAGRLARISAALRAARERRGPPAPGAPGGAARDRPPPPAPARAGPPAARAPGPPPGRPP